MSEKRWNEVEALLSERAKRPVSLDAMADDWTRFAMDIGKGYWGTIDDYTHDVYCRDILEEALALLAEPDRASLLAQVDEGDRLYREVTADDPSDRMSAFFRHRDYWWWLRTPIADGRQLITDGFMSPGEGTQHS